MGHVKVPIRVRLNFDNEMRLTKSMNVGLCNLNVINGVINQKITITLSPAEAGDLNASFELLAPAA